MMGTKVQGRPSSRSRSLAFVGLTIAIMAVSAWVTVPLGPVPFTLQMFAVTFALAVLSPRETMASVAGYVALGAVGVPVFSGMRGGIGVLAGPTGGFLWGYLIGAAAAVMLLKAVRSRGDVGAGDGAAAGAKKRALGAEIAAGLLFTAVSYACGWAQYMVVTGVDPLAAFLVCVAPFAVVDVVKIVAAVMCARAVRAAVR